MASTAEQHSKWSLPVDGFRLRVATIADLAAVLHIERGCYQYPWPSSFFTSEFENDWTRLMVVVDHKGRVVAFIMFGIVEDELHLLNLAVDPDWQRHGIGSALVAYCDAVSAECSLTYLMLEVRVSNHQAVSMYEKFGYTVERRRKNYYVEEGEDAFVMSKVIET